MATPVYSNDPYVTILNRSYVEHQVACGRSFESLSPNTWKMYKSPKAPSETESTDGRFGPVTPAASRTGVGKNKAKKSGPDSFERAAFRIVRTVRESLDTRKTDIFRMVRAAVDFGNDLLLPQVNVSDAEYNDFERIKHTYGLVRDSNPRLSRAVNLITVAEMFPVVACMYVHYFARNTIVPYSRMDTLCPFYPKVMMTSAFAYLLPVTDEQYSTDLLNAHMLHQFEYELTMVDPEVRAKADSLPIPFEAIVITNVTCYTEVAYRRSRVGYMEQIKFLVAFDLVEIDDGMIVAAQNVVDAAKAWEELVRKYV